MFLLVRKNESSGRLSTISVQSVPFFMQGKGKNFFFGAKFIKNLNLLKFAEKLYESLGHLPNLSFY